VKLVAHSVEQDGDTQFLESNLSIPFLSFAPHRYVIDDLAKVSDPNIKVNSAGAKKYVGER